MSFPEYERIAHARPRKAAPPANLSVIEEDQATGEVAELYAQFRSRFGRPDVPGILKCFATHPPLLRHMMELSESLIFADGHLNRRQKEMIAAFISVQNECPYCADSHGFFFRVHGRSSEALCAIQENRLAASLLSGQDQALLAFVDKVNRNSSSVCREDINELLRAGFGLPQIAEAIHIASLFSTFNRVANAFGLQSQGLLELVPQSPSSEQ